MQLIQLVAAVRFSSPMNHFVSHKSLTQSSAAQLRFTVLGTCHFSHARLVHHHHRRCLHHKRTNNMAPRRRMGESEFSIFVAFRNAPFVVLWLLFNSIPMMLYKSAAWHCSRNITCISTAAAAASASAIRRETRNVCWRDN